MSIENFDLKDFKENEYQSRIRLDKLKRTWGLSNKEEKGSMIKKAEKYLATNKTSRDPNEQSKIDAYLDFLTFYK